MALFHNNFPASALLHSLWVQLKRFFYSIFESYLTVMLYRDSSITPYFAAHSLVLIVLRHWYQQQIQVFVDRVVYLRWIEIAKTNKNSEASYKCLIDICLYDGFLIQCSLCVIIIVRTTVQIGTSM